MKRLLWLALLYCCCNSVWGNNSINSYKKINPPASTYPAGKAQYWFDTAFAQHQIINLNNLAQIDELIDMSGLTSDYHIFHIRFTTDDSSWSSISSTRFIKNSSNGNSICQYWFDDSPQRDSFIINNIAIIDNEVNTNTLNNGFHTLHTRFRVAGGAWSSITSTRFLKNSDGSGINTCEYWFNNDATKQTFTVANPFTIDEELNTATLAAGYNVLHTRFKINGGAWSGITSTVFAKTAYENQPSKIEYWFDTAYILKQTKNVADITNIDDTITTNTVDTGWHILNTRVMYNGGMWSSVVIDTFYKNSVDTFAISALAQMGGSISDSGISNVVIGSSKTYYITTDSGYCVMDVLVDNVSVGRVDSFAFIGITAPHTIQVLFTPQVNANISISFTNNPLTNCVGTVAHFTATAVNGGEQPMYQWMKNGINVGDGKDTISLYNLQNNDSVWCVVTSNYYCLNNAVATSNKIKIAIPVTVNNNVYKSGCNSVVYNGITYTSSINFVQRQKSVQGCDSIVTNVFITVYQQTITTQNNYYRGCNVISFRGNNYGISATVKDTIRNRFGCDSVVVNNYIVVTTVNAVINHIQHNGCVSVVFNGTTYTANTTKQDTVKSYQGCDSVYNVHHINIIPLPNVQINAVSDSICAGSSIVLTATGASGFVWNMDTTLSNWYSASTTAIPTATTTYTVTSDDVCAVSKSITIYIKPLPWLNAGQDQYMYKGSSLYLTASSNGSVVWNDGTLIDSAANKILIAPASTQYFIATATLNGCSVSDSVLVDVYNIELTPSTNYYNFGNVATGVTQQAVITVTNTGNVPFTIDSITTQTPFGKTPLQATIAAGATQNISFNFTPTANLFYLGNLEIHHQFGAHNITLQGKGVTPMPKWGVNSSSLNFGYTTIGDSLSKAISISNTGNVPLNLDSIINRNNVFSVVGNGTILNVGATIVITIKFKPNAIGLISDVVYIKSNQWDLSEKINISGFGYINSIKPILQFVSEQPYNSSKGINPEVAMPQSMFTYKIVYKSATNTPPMTGYPQVGIDRNNDAEFIGTNEGLFAMSKVSNTTNWSIGEEYIFTTNLPIGNTYTYQFFAIDSLGNVALQTNTQAYGGPIVTDQLLDLSIYANDISFSVTNPSPNQSFTVYATVHNNTPYSQSNINVRFYTDSIYYNQTTLPFIGAYSNAVVSMSLVYSTDGFYPIKVWVDSAGLIMENNKLNNYAIRPVTVGNFSVPGSIEIEGNTLPFYCPEMLYVYGNAKYSHNNSLVSGALVTIKENGNLLATTYTNINGFYSFAGMHVCGSNSVQVQVTDFTLTSAIANFSYNIDCNNICNLWNIGSGGTGAGAGSGTGGSNSSGGGLNNLASFTGAGNSSYVDGCLSLGENITYHNYFSNLGSIALNDTIIVLLDGVEKSETIFSQINTGETKYIKYDFSPVNSSRIVLTIKHIYYDINGIRKIDTREQAIYINERKPDYSIQSVTQNGNTLSIVIKNESCSNIAPSNIINVYKSSSNLSYILPSLLGSVNIASIDKGASASYTFNVGNLSSGNNLLKIIVDPNNVVDEIREYNNNQEINVYLLKPDAKVEGLQVSSTNIKQGDSINFVATIVNNGSLAFPVSTAQFYINNIQFGSKINMTGIGVGASKFIQSGNFIIPFNNCNLNIKVVIDSDNQVDEDDEQNNTATVNLGTDLSVSVNCNQLGSSCNPFVINKQNSINLFATIYNSGLRDIDSTNVYFYKNGNVIGISTLAAIASMSSGIAGVDYVFDTVGSYEIVIKADDENKYCEIDESNNIGSIFVNVRESLPDLQVYSQHISPSNLNPAINQNITIATTVQNVGNLKSNATSLIFEVDNVQLGQAISINSILPGKDTTVLANATYSNGNNGPKVVRVIVNPQKNQEEITFANNVASRAIIVGAAPDFAKAIHEGLLMSKIKVKLGDMVQLSSYVRNYGGLAGVAKLKFYKELHGSKTIISSHTISLNANDSIKITSSWTVDAVEGNILSVIEEANPEEFNTLNNTETLPISIDFEPGITVIVHGFQLGGSFPDDFITMGKEIIKRAGGGVIYKNNTATGQLELVDGSFDPTKEVVLLYDWAVLSNNSALFNNSGVGYLESAADNLFSTFMQLGSMLNVDRTTWFGKPNHFIGHSRGTILLLQTLHRFANYFPNFKVEHLTFLDPHPASTFGDVKKQNDNTTFNLPCVSGYAGSCSITQYCWNGDNIELKIPVNVKRAECYFRKDFLYESVFDPSGFASFNGLSIPDLSYYNRQLDDNLLSIGSTNFGGTHSAVHSWFRGTINTKDPVATTNLLSSAKTLTKNWYEPSMTYYMSNKFLTSESRYTTGFYHSRIGGGPLVPELTTGKESLLAMNQTLALKYGVSNINGMEPETVYGGKFLYNNDAGWRENGGNTNLTFLQFANNRARMASGDLLKHSKMYFPSRCYFLKINTKKHVFVTNPELVVNFYNLSDIVIDTKSVTLQNNNNLTENYFAIPTALIDNIGKFSIKIEGNLQDQVDLSNIELVEQLPINPTINISNGLYNCTTGATTFTSVSSNTCLNTVYNWYKNNVIITQIINGAITPINNVVYYAVGLQPNDNIYCLMTTTCNGISSAYKSNTITIPALIAPAATTGSTSVCVGSSIQLNNTTANGVWSSTAGRATVNRIGVVTGTSAGVANIKYTAVNEIGCPASSNFSVQVNAIPEIPTIKFALGTTGISGSGGYCKNKPFTLVGKPLGGLWSSTGTASGFNINATSGVVNTGNVTGTVNVTYTTTDANGCSNNRTIPSNIVTCTSKGIVTTNDLITNNFIFYPNPAHTTISLKVDKLIGRGSIIITNLLGKQLKQQPLSMGINAIDVSTFAKGMYLVSIITNTGKQTQKIVVE